MDEREFREKTGKRGKGEKERGDGMGWDGGLRGWVGKGI